MPFEVKRVCDGEVVAGPFATKKKAEKDLIGAHYVNLKNLSSGNKNLWEMRMMSGLPLLEIVSTKNDKK